MRTRKILFCLFTLCFSALCMAQDNTAYSVIVNAGNTIDSVNAEDLKNIFLGKKTTWPSGKQITVATLEDGDAHKAFLKDVVKKNPQQFSMYWKKETFTGTGVAPKSFKNENDLKEFIKTNPGAVGYVAPATVDSSIKKITVK